MNTLAVDIIAHICSYLQRNEPSLLAYRTINRAFNSAVISFRPLWLEILGDKGPYMIGPASKHVDLWGLEARCKMSKKTGKCHIASHYLTYTLIPRYAAEGEFSAYRTAIKIVHEKYVKRMRALARHAERKLQTLEQQYEAKKRKFTRERDDATDRLKRAKV